MLICLSLNFTVLVKILLSGITGNHTFNQKATRDKKGSLFCCDYIIAGNSFVKI
jgi:hypothetical protein